MSEKKQLNNEELEKVAGGSNGEAGPYIVSLKPLQSGSGIADGSAYTDGSHVEPEDIHNYAGKDMIFTFGIFGLHGPYRVHINSVNGTVINMSFYNLIDSKAVEAADGVTVNWTKIDDYTWEWDYDDHWCNWLE